MGIKIMVPMKKLIMQKLIQVQTAHIMDLL